jgi:hypothetical protein
MIWVKIQGEACVLGTAVRDGEGRRLGRVVAVDCAPDPYTVAWFVLRLPGWRRQLRAVPAFGASWLAQGVLCVPYRRELVADSPVLHEDGADLGLLRNELEAFYATVVA